MEQEIRTTHTQIIGAGPAGIGIAVAADRLYGDQLFRQGLGFIDASLTPGAGNLADIQHTSNSPAIEFLEGVRRDGYFSPVFGDESTRMVEAYGTNPLPLFLVGGFLELLGKRVKELSQAYERSFLLTETPVHHVVFDAESETYTSYSSQRAIARSQNLVLATGAKEVLHPDLKEYEEKVVFSSDIAKDPELTISQQNGQIVVLGGSHSAFAISNLIHMTNPDRNITIAHRSPIKLFYESATEADDAGYTYTQDDICPNTGRVFRFGGIRTDAKILYENIQHGVVPNINMVQSDCFPKKLLENASVIIQAFGYQANSIPLLDKNGRHIGPKIERGIVRTDGLARVFTISGETLENVYSIGIGHGIKPNPTIGGEPSYHATIDGVNVFHGPVAESIVKQLYEVI